MDKLTKNQLPGNDIPPNLTIDEIMAVLRQKNQAIISPFGPDLLPSELSPDDSAPLLAFLLRQISQPDNLQGLIQPQLTPLPLDKLPLIGILWNNLRRQLHGLSVFYAQKTVGQLMEYNRRLLAILNLTMQQQQRQQRELAELKQRLVSLETPLFGQERQE